MLSSMRMGKKEGEHAPAAAAETMVHGCCVSLFLFTLKIGRLFPFLLRICVYYLYEMLLKKENPFSLFHL